MIGFGRAERSSLQPVLLLLLTMTVTGNAFSENLDDAVEAMQRGDFAQAYCIMRPLAESGDAESQYNLGWMYLNGYGLRVDESKALAWWTKASEQGDTEASFSIGMLYGLGEGKIAKDENRAIDYYLIAALDGHEDAIKLLQYMMMRNDEDIRARLHAIINQHSSLFGTTMTVAAKKLNAREGPSVKESIVTHLLQDQKLVELQKQDKWSQVIVLGDEQTDQAVWVYSHYLKKVIPQVGTSNAVNAESGPASGPASGSTYQAPSQPASQPPYQRPYQPAYPYGQ